MTHPEEQIPRLCSRPISISHMAIERTSGTSRGCVGSNNIELSHFQISFRCRSCARCFENWCACARSVGDESVCASATYDINCKSPLY